MKVNITAKMQKRNFARFTFDLFQVSKIKAHSNKVRFYYIYTINRYKYVNSYLD